MTPHSLKNQKVLVTGASGFVGPALVKRLLDDGAIVSTLSRTPGRLSMLEQKYCYQFFSCDLTDKQATLEVLSEVNPQVVFHLASLPDGPESYEHSLQVIESNLNGTVNLLEGFRRVGGMLFVYGDSTKSYGNSGVPYLEANPWYPNSSYAITKAAGWSFCLMYANIHDFSTVSVRSTMLYGPGQSFNLFSFLIQSLRKGVLEIPIAGGLQTRDPLYIDDAVDAYIMSAKKELSGRIINIGGGVERSVKDLSELVVRLAGYDTPIICNPADARSTEIWNSYCDNIEARKLTGWSPNHSIEEGLLKTIDYLMNRE
jgi:nucleoside-diphosphate-sugar epimerase